MRRSLLALALMLPVALTAAPALAITDGVPDGNGHPYVGLMVAQDKAGTPLWRCSGTLIAPKVFLTAGHCTEAPAARAEIWFQSDVQSGIPGNGYPYTGQASGKTYTHPEYNPDNFSTHDLGVVVLDQAVKLSTYGKLPSLGAVSTYAAKKGSSAYMTAVGYGLQKAFPDATSWKESAQKVRMVAEPKINQIDGGIAGTESLILSNNANTGGTCFGDSGGPNFIASTTTVGGVTSFGLNGTCGGTGGVYRVDRPDDLDWLNAAFGKLLK